VNWLKLGRRPKINITRVSAHVVNGEPVAGAGSGQLNWRTRTTPRHTHSQIRCFEDVDLNHFIW
jgi:cobalt-precorrin 5A hydrolase